MKITDVRTVRLRAPIPAEGQVISRSGPRSSRSAVLIEVRTDVGISGVGSCSGNGRIIDLIIETILKPVVIGMDPTKTDDIWDRAYFRGGLRQVGSRGIGVVALSGLDMALWDIRGKVENVPVFKLLGGAKRDRVEVYATALYPEATATVVKRALAFAEQGFKGVKLKLGFDFAQDMERVRAVRDAVGKNFPIMTDANMGYEIDAALRAAEVLEECGVSWLEEPLFVEDIEGHAKLKAGSKVPIALGENLHTRYAFEQFIARGAVDILQPDVARAGGITEVRRIGSLAAAHGLPISLHTWGDAVALAASLHLSAAVENSIVMELDCTANPLRTELLTEPLEARRGWMQPPDGPGLGIELNPNALERYAFAGDDEIALRGPALRLR
jgi:D-galactarolactone cycloisomerase